MGRDRYVNGFSIQTAGTVLFVLGILGLVLSLIYTFACTRRTTRDDDGLRSARRAGDSPVLAVAASQPSVRGRWVASMPMTSSATSAR